MNERVIIESNQAVEIGPRRRNLLWLLAPLAVLIAAFWWLMVANPLASFNNGAPPVENLTVERTILDYDGLRLLVRGMAVCDDLDGEFTDGAALTRAASDVLRFMDEICDRCGVDTDFDYEHALRTCAALGVFACRAVERALGSESGERLRRRFRRVVKDESQSASPERVIWSCRHFLRTLLMKHKN